MAGIMYDPCMVRSTIMRGNRRAGLQSERARSWSWFERTRARREQWSFVERCDDSDAELLRSMLLSCAIQMRAAEACDGQCIIAEMPE